MPIMLICPPVAVEVPAQEAKAPWDPHDRGPESRALDHLIRVFRNIRRMLG
jgi:hypothetical protein